MKRFALLALCAIFPIASASARGTAASRAAFPVTVTDDLGNHVRIAHRPQRIATLFADYTETIFALGLEKRLVGDGSHYAEGATGITNHAGKPRDFKYPAEWPSKWGRDYPVKAPKLPHIEGGFGGTPFNLETLTSLHPELVIAPYYPSQVQTYQKMRQLGMTILFLNPSSVQGVLHDITLLGAATGEQEHAVILVKALQGDISTVKGDIARVHARPRVYYEIDDSTPTSPITTGRGTVVDEAIKLAGGSNIGDAVSSCSGTTCYPSLSLESIIAQDPQVIVLADAAYGVSVDSVKSRPSWSGISAVRTGKIYTINPDLLSRFGPRIVIGLRTLARLLHPAALKHG